ncbi:MAG: hypothetical protein U9O64_11215 [Campylobacterota bacterium]|nr:hypothetical protein [Campylobacterota bacterium]
MLKKLIILLLILLGLAAVGYYLLYTQGAFQTKEDIYSQTDASTHEMKCAPGKCGASMEKFDNNKTPSKKCVAGGKCAEGKCGNG